MYWNTSIYWLHCSSLTVWSEWENGCITTFLLIIYTLRQTLFGYNIVYRQVELIGSTIQYIGTLTFHSMPYYHCTFNIEVQSELFNLVSYEDHQFLMIFMTDWYYICYQLWLFFHKSTGFYPIEQSISFS